MIKLSKNFRLAEFTLTNTGEPNNPTKEQTAKLLYLAQFILQPARDSTGPIKITSGFRSERVNRAVSGSTSSQHLLGEAADILPLEDDFDLAYDWITKHLHFGQCIKETVGKSRWIHISLPRLDKPNQQALVYDGGEYTFYNPLSYEEGGA